MSIMDHDERPVPEGAALPDLRARLDRRRLLGVAGSLALLPLAEILSPAEAAESFRGEPWDDGTFWDDGTGWVD
jgi:hypothetical protein